MNYNKSQFDLALDGSYIFSDTNIAQPITIGKDFRGNQSIAILRGR